MFVARPGLLLASHGRCRAARPCRDRSQLGRQFQDGARRSEPSHPVRDLADYDRAFGVNFTAAGTDGEVA
ncbi:hypothetical protein ACORG1_08745 [Mycobacterium sp. TJFP1]